MQLYSTRMDLLGKVVRDADPMIVAFQEVRYDEGLGGPGTVLFPLYQPAPLSNQGLQYGERLGGPGTVSGLVLILHSAGVRFSLTF
jgi:hypothetical protein